MYTVALSNCKKGSFFFLFLMENQEGSQTESFLFEQVKRHLLDISHIGEIELNSLNIISCK